MDRTLGFGQQRAVKVSELTVAGHPGIGVRILAGPFFL